MTFVYMSNRQEALMFGGQDVSDRYLNDTWTWKAGCWTQRTPGHNPAARAYAAAAYDAVHQYVVIYGSYALASGFAADTWTWNGDDWQQATTAEPPLSAAVAAYDPNIQRIVLFAERMAQTWTWDGTQWQQMSPDLEPSGILAGASMTFDPVTRTVLLFGGIGFTHAYLADTWVWNGTTWHHLSPQTSPPARARATLVASSSTRHVLLVGGENGTVLADAWEWDGATWSAVASIGPRVGAGAIDTGTSVVVFGGSTDKQKTSEAWSWNGVSWSKS
jgi:hypothetical protein